MTIAAVSLLLINMWFCAAHDSLHGLHTGVVVFLSIWLILAAAAVALLTAMGAACANHKWVRSIAWLWVAIPIILAVCGIAVIGNLLYVYLELLAPM